MDAVLEDALTTWFEAEQEARSAPWSGMVGEQRRFEHARTQLKLQLSAEKLYQAAIQSSTNFAYTSRKKSKRA